MTERAQEVETLVKNLLATRDFAEETRIACFATGPVDWGALLFRMQEESQDVGNMVPDVQRLFPDNQRTLVPLVLSASFALRSAGPLVARCHALSMVNAIDMTDTGHFNVIQKHINSSRCSIGALARETREATHIAQFIINRLDGVGHAKSA